MSGRNSSCNFRISTRNLHFWTKRKCWVLNAYFRSRQKLNKICCTPLDTFCGLFLTFKMCFQLLGSLRRSPRLTSLPQTLYLWAGGSGQIEMAETRDNGHVFDKLLKKKGAQCLSPRTPLPLLPLLHGWKMALKNLALKVFKKNVNLKGPKFSF